MLDEPATAEAELPLHRHLHVLLPYLRPAADRVPQLLPTTAAAAAAAAPAAVAAAEWLSLPEAPTLRLSTCGAYGNDALRACRTCIDGLGAPVPLRLLMSLFHEAEADGGDPYGGNALALLPVAEESNEGLILHASGTNMDSLMLRSSAAAASARQWAQWRPEGGSARLQQVCSIAAPNISSAGWLAAARSAYSMYFVRVTAEDADTDGAVTLMARARFGRMLTHVCLNPRQAITPPLICYFPESFNLLSLTLCLVLLYSLPIIAATSNSLYLSPHSSLTAIVGTCPVLGFLLLKLVLLPAHRPLPIGCAAKQSRCSRMVRPS